MAPATPMTARVRSRHKIQSDRAAQVEPRAKSCRWHSCGLDVGTYALRSLPFCRRRECGDAAVDVVRNVGSDGARKHRDSQQSNFIADPFGAGRRRRRNWMLLGFGHQQLNVDLLLSICGFTDGERRSFGGRNLSSAGTFEQEITGAPRTSRAQSREPKAWMRSSRWAWSSTRDEKGRCPAIANGAPTRNQTPTGESCAHWKTETAEDGTRCGCGSCISSSGRPAVLP